MSRRFLVGFILSACVFLTQSLSFSAPMTDGLLRRDGSFVGVSKLSWDSSEDGKKYFHMTLKQFYSNTKHENFYRHWGTNQNGRSGFTFAGADSVRIISMIEGPGGEILILGEADVPEDGVDMLRMDVFAMLLDENGRPDKNFFANGLLHQPMDTGEMLAAGFSPDGRIILATIDHSDPQMRAVFWRFAKDPFSDLWEVDRSWADGGRMSFSIEPSEFGFDWGTKFLTNIRMSQLQVSDNGSFSFGGTVTIFGQKRSQLREVPHPGAHFAYYFDSKTKTFERRFLRYIGSRELSLLRAITHYDQTHNIFTVLAPAKAPRESEPEDLGRALVINLHSSSSTPEEATETEKRLGFHRYFKISGPDPAAIYVINAKRKGPNKAFAYSAVKDRVFLLQNLPSQVRACPGAFVNLSEGAID